MIFIFIFTYFIKIIIIIFIVVKTINNSFLFYYKQTIKMFYIILKNIIKKF